MDIYINKSSGKCFIIVEELDKETALFITPLGEIKPLLLQFFEKKVNMEIEHLISKKLITEAQAKRYYKYHETMISKGENDN